MSEKHPMKLLLEGWVAEVEKIFRLLCARSGDYEKAIGLAEEIGAMLWGIIRKI